MTLDYSVHKKCEALDREETRKGWILPNSVSERPRGLKVVSLHDRKSHVRTVYFPGVIFYTYEKWAQRRSLMPEIGLLLAPNNIFGTTILKEEAWNRE